MASRSSMRFNISAEPGYLRAELSGRETVEETQTFLRAIVRENAKHPRQCVLIVVRTSKPVFQVAAHRLIEYIQRLAGKEPLRIALVGDTWDLHVSHEYIELLARQRGLNVQSFGGEAAALEWLKGPVQPGSARPRQERRGQQDRRMVGERRRQERRARGAPGFQPA